MRRILLAIGIIIAVAVWHLRLRFPFDDVFISFRYAEHVAKGYGLVWNIGGPHTEGFTNFLFVMLLAAARLVTTHLLAVSQIIGLAATIASGILLFSIVEPLRDRAAGLFAAALFWATPLTWINALSGMETSLFVLWLLLAVYCAEVFLDGHPEFANRRSLPFLCAACAALTRPEGALMGLLLLVSLWLSDRLEHRERPLQFVFYPFLIGAIPLAIYIGWKFWYFGKLLPNSFYVKVSDPAGTLLPGLQYVRLFATSALVVIALSLCVRRWKNPILLIAGFWIVSLMVFYLFVRPLEGLYDRFLWPVFAMLCITAAVGAHDLALRRGLRPVPLFAAALVAIQVTLSLLSPRTRQAFAAHEDYWDASMDRIVRELKMLPDFDYLHFAYGDAGYVVYRSGIHQIDLFGLNDTRIALARSTAERANIVRSERPDILLLPVYSLDTCYEWVEDAYGLARQKEFQPVASTGAFPFRLVWVLNTQSPYYKDCDRALSSRIGISGSALDSASPLCYSTR